MCSFHKTPVHHSRWCMVPLSLIGSWTPAFGFQISFPFRFIMETECCCHNCKKRTFRIYVFMHACMYVCMHLCRQVCVYVLRDICVSISHMFTKICDCYAEWFLCVVGLLVVSNTPVVKKCLRHWGFETLNLKGCFVCGLQQQSTLHCPVSLASKQPVWNTIIIQPHTPGTDTEQIWGPG